MIIRFLHIFSFMLLAVCSHAQEAFLTDTAYLKEILVQVKKVEQLGFRQMQVSDENKTFRLQASLAELLSYELPMAVRQYSPGGMASASVRGGNASHTQVLWNGLTINSPMLGQADLSQISALVADKIALMSGGNPNIDNSGALGGTISLTNNSEWTDTFNAQLHQQSNSLNTHKTALLVKGTYRNVKLALKTYSSFADFSQTNLDEMQRNSRFIIKGQESDFYWKISDKHRLTLHTWTQLASHVLPSRLPEDEKQKDYFVRTVLIDSRDFELGEWENKFSYQHNFTDYKIESLEVHSVHRTSGLTYQSSFSHAFNKNLLLKSGMKAEYQWCESTNYLQIESRPNLSLYTSLNYIRRQLALYVLLKQDIYSTKQTPFVPSAGIDFDFRNAWNTHFKAGVSKNYRIPTFNDLYWTPGGNPNLKNEEGYSGEMGFYNQLSTAWGSIGADLTGFYSQIYNWIAWQPQSSYVWVPQNFMQVNAYGTELSTSAEYKTDIISHKLWAYYMYNHVSGKNNTDATSRAIMYKPRHQSTLNWRTVYRQQFSIQLNQTYVGTRYVSSNEELQLPAVWLNSVSVGFETTYKKLVYKLAFDIQNAGNVKYEWVMGYPMPGRYFGASLSFQYKD